MLFFKNKTSPQKIVDLSLMFISLVLAYLNLWMKSSYEIDSDRFSYMQAAIKKQNLNATGTIVKVLNLDSMLGRLHVLVDSFPQQFKIKKMHFSAQEIKLSGWSASIQDFSDFCQILRGIPELNHFQILHWQDDQPLGYQFIMVWS
jgi:hypothetical protein